MDRMRHWFSSRALKPDEREYEALTAEEPVALEDPVLREERDGLLFSWFEYSIFFLLGMAMLWAWNMFLAAAPYFQTRFAADPALASTFQPAILTVSTISNLGILLTLQHMQQTASYTYRINLALVLSTATFALLTASTVVLAEASVRVYFMFVLATVAASSWACGLVQNGAFAFAASFGRPEYVQGLLAGQAVAGVLPPVAEVLSVLLVPGGLAGGGGSAVDETAEGGMSGPAAFVYFLTAVVVSLTTLIAFAPLVRRHESRAAEHVAESLASVDAAERTARRVTGMRRLLARLHWHAAATAICFALSMSYPVFTTRISSVHAGDPDASRFVHPAVFIPVAFLCWNVGDLAGRLAASLPFSGVLRDRPAALFVLSVARAGFLPLYAGCNVDGQGAAVASDAFYLVIVQFGFGLTNGWVGANCMMAAVDHVDDVEREAAGSFMALCLVVGLSVGSVLSFAASG